MITILNLSDIHLGTINQAQKYFMQIKSDLVNELKIKKLDYIVASGDIANYSTPEDYEASVDLFSQLIDNFMLDSDKVIVVPGNHDLNWDISKESYKFEYKDNLSGKLTEGRYILAGDQGALICDDDLYQQRFFNFNEYFYKKLFNKDYPLNFENQAIVHDYNNDKLLFLALNSCWEIDHEFRDRSGINGEALTNAFKKIIAPQYNGWLKIAVFHHPVSGPQMMKCIDFLEQLSVQGFQIIIHGHIHEAIEGYHKYDS